MQSQMTNSLVTVANESHFLCLVLQNFRLDLIELRILFRVVYKCQFNCLSYVWFITASLSLNKPITAQQENIPMASSTEDKKAKPSDKKTSTTERSTVKETPPARAVTPPATRVTSPTPKSPSKRVNMPLESSRLIKPLRETTNIQGEDTERVMVEKSSKGGRERTSQMPMQRKSPSTRPEVWEDHCLIP